MKYYHQLQTSSYSPDFFIFTRLLHTHHTHNSTTHQTSRPCLLHLLRRHHALVIFPTEALPRQTSSRSLPVNVVHLHRSRLTLPFTVRAQSASLLSPSQRRCTFHAGQQGLSWADVVTRISSTSSAVTATSLIWWETLAVTASAEVIRSRW